MKSHTFTNSLAYFGSSVSDDEKKFYNHDALAGGARTKEPTKPAKQRSPSEGSEAYGTGSTTSAVEQPHMDDEDDNNEEGRGQSRHSRLFRCPCY